MINTNEIHLSVTEADDLEEIHDGQISIGDVLRSIVQHPFQIVKRWNWKVALIGSLVRASFYFTVYRASRESWIVTLTAVLVEIAFRFLTSGLFGALVQSFRRASPAWLATTIVTLLFPVLSHLIEYLTHFAQENWFSSIFPKPDSDDARLRTFAISVLFSVLSALFNMYMMRHGVLLVGAGEETKSFKDDLKSVPKLVVDFTIYLPNQIVRFAREGKILWAIGLFVSFGLAVGTILGTCRGRWVWARNTALGAWGLLLFAVIGSIIFAVIAHYKNRQAND